MSNDALIVVDMLNGFLVPGYPLYSGKDCEDVIPTVRKVIERFPSDRIIYVCDNHEEDDPEFKIWPKHCLKGSVESEIVDELKPFKGRVVPKTRFSGFYGTDLDKIVQEMNPEKVVVVGVCTDICVMHTVADLRNRNYDVEVPKNCVASFDRENHEFALKHMKSVLGAEIV